MGWKFDIDCHPSQYRLVQIGPAKGMLNTPLSTNISVADIVNHCYEIGLVERPVQPRTNAAAAGDAVAFAAHPSHPKIPIVAQESQATGTFTDEHGFFAGVSNSTAKKRSFLTSHRCTVKRKPTSKPLVLSR